MTVFFAAILSISLCCIACKTKTDTLADTLASDETSQPLPFDKRFLGEFVNDNDQTQILKITYNSVGKKFYFDSKDDHRIVPADSGDVVEHKGLEVFQVAVADNHSRAIWLYERVDGGKIAGEVVYEFITVDFSKLKIRGTSVLMIDGKPTQVKLEPTFWSRKS